MICLHVSGPTTWYSAHIVQKRALDTLDLGLQTVVSYHVYKGTCPRTSARAAIALYHWAESLAPVISSLKNGLTIHTHVCTHRHTHSMWYVYLCIYVYILFLPHTHTHTVIPKSHFILRYWYIIYLGRIERKSIFLQASLHQMDEGTTASSSSLTSSILLCPLVWEENRSFQSKRETLTMLYADTTWSCNLENPGSPRVLWRCIASPPGAGASLFDTWCITACVSRGAAVAWGTVVRTVFHLLPSDVSTKQGFLPEFWTILSVGKEVSGVHRAPCGC